MATVAELLASALRFHQGGALEQAEQLYRQILEVDPLNVDAMHLLGLLAGQAGRNHLAIDHLSQALRLRPNFAGAHYNLGVALEAVGRLEEAGASYQQALRLRPKDAGAHYNLGVVLAAQGKPEEAVASFQEALRLKPGHAEAHLNLANALQAQGKLEEAVANYRQALRLQPNSAEAHNNLGIVFQAQEKREEAVASFRQALRLQPDYAEAHNNLGNALQGQGRLEEAVASYQEALRLAPNYANAHYNLGNVLQVQGKLKEAGAAYKKALHFKPQYAEAHNNLGVVLQEQGDWEGALARYQEALGLNPNYADAHFNLGRVWLLLGNFGPGWAEYEWRWKCKELSPPPFRQPPWDGSPLGGQTILLHAEQGLGDTLQFIRYAPLVKQRGGRVVVACQERLLQVLGKSPGIDQLLALGSALPAFDVHAPLLSLPGILGTSLETIPAPVPYLLADPDLIEKWRCRLAPLRGLKVGINWRGRPDNPSERHRGIPLVHFQSLARIDGVGLISLQKDYGKEELDAIGDRLAVMDMGSQLDGAAGPFMDTGALMKALDLVITSDTVIPHLAGALGVPVWVALPFAPDWRWLLDREDSPWYPTMRLFRQRRPGDWAEVFERIAAALAQRGNR